MSNFWCLFWMSHILERTFLKPIKPGANPANLNATYSNDHSKPETIQLCLHSDEICLHVSAASSSLCCHGDVSLMTPEESNSSSLCFGRDDPITKGELSWTLPSLEIPFWHRKMKRSGEREDELPKVWHQLYQAERQTMTRQKKKNLWTTPGLMRTEGLTGRAVMCWQTAAVCSCFQRCWPQTVSTPKKITRSL